MGVLFNLVKKHVENLYDSTVQVIGYTTAEGIINNSMETVLYDAVPCRISIESSPNGIQTDSTDNVSQTIKLFCSPDYNIPAGSKIVTSDNTVFISSGIPAKYKSHQEINLVSEVNKA
ncbi:MAG: hypothetical protein LKJ25_04345 [Clostridia bacterium]|jgi:hypothetical protein|nr:hypothetical protein [Clostridia bacterium]